MLINELQKKINYKFKDISLLKEALIHSSYVPENSQKNIIIHIEMVDMFYGITLIDVKPFLQSLIIAYTLNLDGYLIN